MSLNSIYKKLPPNDKELFSSKLTRLRSEQIIKDELAEKKAIEKLNSYKVYDSVKTLNHDVTYIMDTLLNRARKTNSTMIPMEQFSGLDGINEIYQHFYRVNPNVGNDKLFQTAKGKYLMEQILVLMNALSLKSGIPIQKDYTSPTGMRLCMKYNIYNFRIWWK